MESEIVENLDIHNSFGLSEILRKHIQQQPLTTEESEKLNQWLAASERNQQIFASLGNEDELASTLKRLYRTDTRAQLDIVNRRIAQSLKARKRSYWLPVAASLTIIFGISLWVYTHKQPAVSEGIALTSIHGEDILPGTNKATLTLSTGKTITLDEAKSGIINTANGLAYEDGSQLGAVETARYATLSTPIGGQYKVTLPDGTTVWMNAESSLEYPTKFGNDQRRVVLRGDAYFEVQHDTAKPFIVQTHGQQIRVLGTTFNVKAYANEQRTTTTLLTGLVKINTEGNKEEGSSIQSVTLHPGHQAIKLNGRLTVDEVVPTYAIAWKDGEFVFRNESLTNVMKQLQRWYEFSVDYDSLPPLHFTGGIKRNVSLSEVLKMLEQTSTVRFQIKNKRVSIISS